MRGECIAKSFRDQYIKLKYLSVTLTPIGVTSMRFKFTNDFEMTIGNPNIRREDWPEKYPVPQTWVLEDNEVFIGMEVWQSETAIRAVGLITLNKECLAKAEQNTVVTDPEVEINDNPVKTKEDQETAVTDPKVEENDNSSKNEVTITPKGPRPSQIAEQENSSGMRTEIVILIAIVSFAVFLAALALCIFLYNRVKASN